VIVGGKRRAVETRQWHGRSTELADVGPVSWQLLWEALAVDVLDSNVEAMSSLGLRAVRDRCRR
jgi:hypothetical protein